MVSYILYVVFWDFYVFKVVVFKLEYVRELFGEFVEIVFWVIGLEIDLGGWDGFINL